MCSHQDNQELVKIEYSLVKGRTSSLLSQEIKHVQLTTGQGCPPTRTPTRKVARVPWFQPHWRVGRQRLD